MRSTYTGRWFALSVVCLGIGGSFAFLVGMSRMPFASKYLPADYFQHALVGHVVLAILLWLMLSTVVLWSYYLKTPGVEASFWLAGGGAAMVAVTALAGSGDAVLNNYVPVLVNPFFFIGLGLFFTGFSINVFTFLKVALKESASDDMAINALSTSILVAVALVVAALSSIALLGGDGDEYLPQVFYERLFWFPGHIQQVLNGALLVALWYSLAEISTGKKPASWPILRSANKSLVVSALILLASLFLLDPLDKSARIGAEIVYAIGLGIPLFMHVANIVRQVKFDFKTPASVSLAFSMTIYLVGVFIAYGGFDNDTRVPAHYHGAVTALTLALMGSGYHMMSNYNLRIVMARAAKFQPYLYGVGMLLFISGLFVSGLFGAPRKTHGVEWTDNPIVLGALTLMGVGTLLAVIGGAIFVLYTCATLLKEEPTK